LCLKLEVIWDQDPSSEQKRGQSKQPKRKEANGGILSALTTSDASSPVV